MCLTDGSLPLFTIEVLSVGLFLLFLLVFFLSLNIKVQLQEAERRWEEVQSYIRKRTAEHEAAQQGKGRGAVQAGRLQPLSAEEDDRHLVEPNKIRFCLFGLSLFSSIR